MKNESRSIFRAQAFERYSQGPEKTSLPLSIRPRAFLCLWIFLGLFLMASVWAGWCAHQLLQAKAPESRQP
jgi:hypothetical protein